MASDPQHCPTCQTEYVAGIPACADCGGPLVPGPLQRYAAPAPGAAAAAAPTAAAFDAVLARLPGLQADRAVRALLLEDIPCFVDCQGLTKTYQPGGPPAEPFAVTLPVTVSVRQADLASAHEVLASLESEDLIGDQWSDAEVAAAAEAAAAEGAGQGEAPATPDDGAPQLQGTSMLTAVLVLAVVLGLLFLFGR
jgi:hypothetical protein